MYEIQIFITGILTVSYLIAAFLVIRETKSLVNVLFSFSTATLALSNFLALLGYLIADGYIYGNYQEIWEVGTIVLVIGPSGFYLSAKVINYGNDTFKQVGSIVWMIFTITLIIAIILLYPLQSEIENISTWDPFIGLLSLGVIYEFYNLYRLKPSWQNKITLIITGFTISVLGLGLNLLTIFITSESSPILRHFPPLVGLTLVIAAFIFIPESQRKIRDWRELNIENREMELLIDLMTHDLLNQLSSSQGYLDFHLMEIEEDNKKEMLLKSKAGTIRAVNLVKTVSILMKSKLEEDHQLNTVPLMRGIESSRSVLLDLFPDKKIILIVEGVVEDDTVLADSLFDYLLINLLTNAVKNDHNETIEIKIKKERVSAKEFKLHIIDQGTGIAPEERKRLFERYIQYKREGKGSGLGLHIVKTLMENYKGSIEIRNTFPEDFTLGTTVILRLHSN